MLEIVISTYLTKIAKDTKNRTCTVTFFVLQTRYTKQNTKFCDGYRKYNSDVPAFLHNKPRPFVLQCLSKISMAQDIPPRHITLQDSIKGIFKVKSQSRSTWYTLEFGDSEKLPSCECLSWQQSCFLCKHFLAIFYHFPDWNWDKLSIQYRNSPYTTLDEAIVGFSSPSVGVDSSAEDVDAVCKFAEMVESFVEEVHCNQQEKRTGAGKKAIQSKASTCRDLLTKLKSATYLVHDAKALDELNTALQSTLTSISGFIPNERGLQLNGEETTPTPPPKKQKKEVLSGATTSTGRKSLRLPKHAKKKHPYTKRVGLFAETMRKMYNVKVPIPSSDNDVRILSVDSSEKEEFLSDYGTNYEQQNKPAEGDCEIKEDSKFGGKNDGTWMKRFQVSSEDEKILHNHLGWLKDRHITAAQDLIKGQFPILGGLVNPLYLSAIMAKSLTEKGLQIHNTGAHWVVSSSLTDRVVVYDSLSLSMAQSLRNQICCLYEHYAKGDDKLKRSMLSVPSNKLVPATVGFLLLPM